jgi:hypothetical protein
MKEKNCPDLSLMLSTPATSMSDPWVVPRWKLPFVGSMETAACVIHLGGAEEWRTSLKTETGVQQ